MIGLVVSVVGVLILTVTRTATCATGGPGRCCCRSRALLRGIIPPVIKVDWRIWPNPIGAGLTGYIVSSLTVLTIEGIRTGHFIVQGPLSGRLWFALNGVVNGVGTLLLYAAVGRRTDHGGGADQCVLSAGDGGSERAGAVERPDHTRLVLRHRDGGCGRHC